MGSPINLNKDPGQCNQEKPCVGDGAKVEFLPEQK